MRFMYTGANDLGIQKAAYDLFKASTGIVLTRHSKTRHYVYRKVDAYHVSNTPGSSGTYVSLTVVLIDKLNGFVP